MNEFAETLQWWIAQNPDLTPTALARKAGLDKTRVRQLIVNDMSPRIDTAQKICGALGVTLDQFFARDRDGKRHALTHLLDHLSDDEIELLLTVARETAARHRAEAK